ncbi:MAG: rhodanese-like domain-containing protein [Actinomycetota bacterium]
MVQTAQEVHALWARGEVAILDVRERDEHERTSVPGVPLIPMSELLERLDEVPDGPLVVMCRSGARSAAVADYLTGNEGRADVANLDGGILAWAAAGLPFDGEPPA